MRELCYQVVFKGRIVWIYIFYNSLMWFLAKGFVGKEESAFVPTSLSNTNPFKQPQVFQEIQHSCPLKNTVHSMYKDQYNTDGMMKIFVFPVLSCY